MTQLTQGTTLAEQEANDLELEALQATMTASLDEAGCAEDLRRIHGVDEKTALRLAACRYGNFCGDAKVIDEDGNPVAGEPVETDPMPGA